MGQMGRRRLSIIIHHPHKKNLMLARKAGPDARVAKLKKNYNLKIEVVFRYRTDITYNTT